jgi:transposase InsO family protein
LANETYLEISLKNSRPGHAASPQTHTSNLLRGYLLDELLADDSYDKAMAETIFGLFKAEVIWPNGPWRSLEEVEFGTLEWVDWFHNKRRLEPIGDIAPAEFETMYYERPASPALAAGLN